MIIHEVPQLPLFMFREQDVYTNKGHYPTVTRQLGEFLYIRKEHVEHNLFSKILRADGLF